MAEDALGTHIGSLHEAISQIEAPGVYLAGVNDSTAASPALVVQGLGHLSVPITLEQSSQLKALCSPDPGHLKDATSDPEKCPAWQLGSSQFQCSNPGWAAYVKTQAGKLLKQMGVPSETIIYPEIQKLVLYRHTWGQLSGTFESTDTAAMMVIVLPSQLQGGTLEVFGPELYLSQQHSLEPDAYTTGCLAFLAGFNYSLGAVKDGYKLALVYRLAQRSAGPLPVFQDISDVMNTMEEDLDLWEAEKLLPKRAFYILENEYDYYCGLRQGTSDLVGRDQTIANALVQMYHRTDIELFLAFVTKEESGGKVSWTADRWQYIGGRLPPLGKVKIHVEEIMQGPDCFAGREPYDAESRGTWRQAALVLWPQCHTDQLFCDSGQDPAVQMLNSMVHNGLESRRRLSKAAAQLTASRADELASAMAAAAEDTLPHKGEVEAACRFATVVWDRFSLSLLNAKERPHEQFVHLIHELGMDRLAVQIADRLKETEQEYGSRHAAMWKQRIANGRKHRLLYPEDSIDEQYCKRLDLTPSTARELVLLAELVGWAAFVPVLLDMASRPDYCVSMYCSWDWRLGHVWGGFKALNVLSKKARGPGSQPLVKVLPAMAVAVSQTALKEGKNVFVVDEEHAYNASVQATYQRFVLYIAYIISDLAVLVSEEGKSELKALHDSFVELYIQQTYGCSLYFFHSVFAPACQKMASCGRGRGKLAVCPILQSLLQACIARLEELTKDAPQKPKDWACDATLNCDAKVSPSADEGLCTTCCRFQAFLRDGTSRIFTATLSIAEFRHLSDVMWEVSDFEHDMPRAAAAAGKGKKTYTYTQQHRTYDRALATHNDYLGQIATLKRGFTN